MEWLTKELCWGSTAIILVTGIWAFLWWNGKNDDYWKKRGVPYIPRQNFFQVMWTLHKNPFHDLIRSFYKQYGRAYGTFEFRKPVLVVSDPDLLRDILVKDFNAFHYRRDMFSEDQIFGKMLTVMKGEDWKRVRTVITPAFTSKRMRQMSKIITQCSQTVVDSLKKHAREGKPAEVKGIFGAFSMDVIALAAFATKIDSLNDPNNIFVKNVKKFFGDFSLIRMLVFFVLPSWIVVKCRLMFFDSLDFFKDVVLQVIKDRKESGKRYDDLLQLLIDAQSEEENSKQLSKIENEDEVDQYGSVTNEQLSAKNLKYKKISVDEMIAQCVLLYMVGYETTGSTLTFLAYSLAKNPECQEKLIQEVDAAFEKHGTFDYDVVRDMKYLDCMVSETLRMHPFLLASERTACEDYKLANTGIVIEKGTTVSFLIYAMHMDPEYFEDPEKFIPERFMPENMKHPPYAYLPFGAGPRNCLGMRLALLEIKVLICNILRHVKFEKTEEPPNYRNAPGTMGVNKMFLKLEERNKT